MSKPGWKEAVLPSNQCDVSKVLTTALLAAARLNVYSQGGGERSLAPEERNVVAAKGNIFAPPELQCSLAFRLYKHLVPPGLKTK